MQLEAREGRLVITRLPVEDMALLSLALPLNPEIARVVAALLAGERVSLQRAGLEYRDYKRTAPLGIYQKFVAMERQLREMGIGVIGSGNG